MKALLLGILFPIFLLGGFALCIWLKDFFRKKPKEKWQRWHEHDNHLAEGIGDPYCILCFNKDGTGACQKNAFPNDN